MGRNKARLNEKQVEVLEWIKGGCPSSGPEDDYRRRITARALERRGLVRVRGHGESWVATVTKAGLGWQQAHPEPRPDESEVDALIERVQAADGRLELPKGEDIRAAHEELVRRSDRSPRRPRGWRLSLHPAGTWSDRRYEVTLVRHFEDLVELVPVPVPAHVARYHPAVKAFIADRDWQHVSREHLERAARILQAIVDEARRRGLEVVTGEQATLGVDAYHARAIARSRFALRSPAGVYGIRIQEVSAPSETKVRPRPWGRRATRARWLDARPTEFVSTGMLELVVDGPGTAYGGDRYRDAKTVSLEDKLGRVFRAIEVHRLEAELREEEREREAAERRRRWEAAMAEARRRYDERVRWDAFVQRSRDWREAAGHREFVAAVRVALASYEGSARHEIAEQLEFAERRLAALDPLGQLERMVPEVRDPAPDDLKPLLAGWSPYGPDSLDG